MREANPRNGAVRKFKTIKTRREGGLIGGLGGSGWIYGSQLKTQVRSFPGELRDFTISEQNNAVSRLAPSAFPPRFQTNSFPNRENCPFLSNTVQ
jgi:hypothetical protein